MFFSSRKIEEFIPSRPRLNVKKKLLEFTGRKKKSSVSREEKNTEGVCLVDCFPKKRKGENLEKVSGKTTSTRTTILTKCNVTPGTNSFLAVFCFKNEPKLRFTKKIRKKLLYHSDNLDKL